MPDDQKGGWGFVVFAVVLGFVALGIGLGLFATYGFGS
jgi:hypothetical protein